MSEDSISHQTKRRKIVADDNRNEPTTSQPHNQVINHYLQPSQ